MTHAQDHAQVRRWRLDNGMTVLFQHNPASQTVAIAGFVRVPITLEHEEQAGIRSLVQGMLIHRPAGPGGVEPVEQLGQYGAVVATSVDYDWARVTVAGLAEYFDSYLAPTRDILLGQEFVWEHLATVRSGQQHLRTATQESALGRASELAYASLFPGTPLAWPLSGTERSLRTVRQADVRRFHEQHWRPNNLVLAISGPMEEEQCRRQVEAVFSRLLPGTGTELPLLRLPDVEPAYLHRPWPTASAVVLMVGRAPAPDDGAHAAARVLAAVLAGGQGSLLWQALRERQPLVYGMEAGIATSRIAATLRVMAVCEATRAAEVFEIINGQISSLRLVPPTAEQVERAIAYLTGNHLHEQQSNLNSAEAIGRLEAMQPGAGPELHSATVRQIQAVTPLQVQQAAQRCTSTAIWVQVGGAPAGT